MEPAGVRRVGGGTAGPAMGRPHPAACAPLSAEAKEVAVVDRPASRPSAPASYPLDLTDPHPIASPDAFWRKVARLASIGIFLIMFGAFLDLARLLLLPVVSAAVVGIMLGPIARLAT